MNVFFKDIGLNAISKIDLNYTKLNIEKGYLYEVLLKTYPLGFETEKEVHVNKKLITFEEYSTYKLKENDLITISEKIEESFVIMIVVNIVISLITSILFTKKPSQPNIGTANTVYSGTVNQIQASVNNPIQIQYGTFRFYPKLISKSYKFYFKNEEYHLLHTCLGLGNINPLQYYLNYTKIEDLEDTKQVQVYSEKKGDKSNYLNRVIDSFDLKNSSEYLAINSYSAEESKNIQINACDYEPIQNEYLYMGLPVSENIKNPIPTKIGYITINPKKTNINRVFINFNFSSGIYGQDDKGNDIVAQAKFNIILKQIDDNDEETGEIISRSVDYSRVSRTPTRISEFFSLKEGRYKIYIERIDIKDSRSVNNCSIMNIIGLEKDTGFDNVENLSLATFLVKSGEGFSSTSGFKMNVLAERESEIINEKVVKYETLLDFVKDVWTNEEYGMGDTLDNLDIQEELSEKVNLILDQKNNAFNHLQNVLKSFNYYIIPYLNHFVIKKDKERRERVLLFTSKNTSKITFSYKLQDKNEKQEGIQARIILDGDIDFTDISYPENMKTYTKTTLLGVNTRDKAMEFLKDLYNKKTKQLKTCKITTDTEALIPELESRVGVETAYLDNSISVEGKSLKNGECILKQNIKLEADKQYYIYIDTENNSNYEMKKIVKVYEDTFTNIIYLEDSSFSISENEIFVITLGDRVEVIEDYIISDIKVGKIDNNIKEAVKVDLILKEYISSLYEDSGAEICNY